jgi:hypothetical protein
MASVAEDQPVSFGDSNPPILDIGLEADFKGGPITPSKAMQ